MSDKKPGFVTLKSPQFEDEMGYSYAREVEVRLAVAKVLDDQCAGNLNMMIAVLTQVLCTALSVRTREDTDKANLALIAADFELQMQMRRRLQAPATQKRIKDIASIFEMGFAPKGESIQ